MIIYAVNADKAARILSTRRFLRNIKYDDPAAAPGAGAVWRHSYSMGSVVSDKEIRKE